jgi:hypothetical protein
MKCKYCQAAIAPRDGKDACVSCKVVVERLKELLTKNPFVKVFPSKSCLKYWKNKCGLE